MTDPAEIEHKIRQLDSDVHELFNVFDELKAALPRLENLLAQNLADQASHVVGAGHRTNLPAQQGVLTRARRPVKHVIFGSPRLWMRVAAVVLVSALLWAVPPGGVPTAWWSL